MDCIRQNHTYKLEHTMFVIAIQEQHLIIAVLHLEVAMRPKPFNYMSKTGPKYTLNCSKSLMWGFIPQTPQRGFAPVPQWGLQAAP
jgi:hypothetical protein